MIGSSKNNPPIDFVTAKSWFYSSPHTEYGNDMIMKAINRMQDGKSHH